MLRHIIECHHAQEPDWDEPHIFDGSNCREEKRMAKLAVQYPKEFNDLQAQHQNRLAAAKYKAMLDTQSQALRLRLGLPPEGPVQPAASSATQSATNHADKSMQQAASPATQSATNQADKPMQQAASPATRFATNHVDKPMQQAASSATQFATNHVDKPMQQAASSAAQPATSHADKPLLDLNLPPVESP
jgi:hypothetical protein